MTANPQLTILRYTILLAVTSLSLAKSAQAVGDSDTLPAPSLAQLESAHLPSLGNTTAEDRLMLREISDQYVYSKRDSGAASARLNNRGGYSPGNERRATGQASTVWEFVAQSERMAIPDHELVRLFTEQYRREARWISAILHRASPFAGHIVDALDERYLPVELALLPAIESGFQPDVISPRLAAGLWQIIPATASEMGINTSAWFDGRSDIQISTTAAIDYLSYLNAEFHGDWLLTLAAYNAGLGRVRNAIKRNQQRQLPIDFWSLGLPRETRNYVPKFLALVNMLRLERLPEFQIPKIARGSAFDIIDIGQRISVDKLAGLAGVSEKKLRNLNAALRHGITPPEGPHVVYVPQGYGVPLIDTLSAQDNTPLYSPSTTHTVVAGDNLSTIAIKYGVPQQQIVELNELPGTLIKIGQKLKLVTSQSEDNSRIEYVVTIGDTLSDIASRFSVNLTDITKADGESLKSDIIHPGERLSLLRGSKTE